MRLQIICAIALISMVRAQAPELHLRGGRFAPLTYDKMTPEQKTMTDHLLSGERGTTSGPFNVTLRDPEMGDLAQKFGATHTVDASTTDPVEAVRGWTDGNGADVCIEAVGNPKVMEQAFFARDLAGTLVQVGVPTPDMRIDLPMIEFFGRGGALKPSWYGDCLPTRDFPKLVDLYLAGRLDLDLFVSETIALDGVEEAFARMQRGEVLRSVVVL